MVEVASCRRILLVQLTQSTPWYVGISSQNRKPEDKRLYPDTGYVTRNDSQ